MALQFGSSPFAGAATRTAVFTRRTRRLPFYGIGYSSNTVIVAGKSQHFLAQAAQNKTACGCQKEEEIGEISQGYMPQAAEGA